MKLRCTSSAAAAACNSAAPSAWHEASAVLLRAGSLQPAVDASRNFTYCPALPCSPYKPTHSVIEHNCGAAEQMNSSMPGRWTGSDRLQHLSIRVLANLPQYGQHGILKSFRHWCAVCFFHALCQAVSGCWTQLGLSFRARIAALLRTNWLALCLPWSRKPQQGKILLQAP